MYSILSGHKVSAVNNSPLLTLGRTRIKVNTLSITKSGHMVNHAQVTGKTVTPNEKPSSQLPGSFWKVYSVSSSSLRGMGKQPRSLSHSNDIQLLMCLLHSCGALGAGSYEAYEIALIANAMPIHFNYCFNNIIKF